MDVVALPCNSSTCICSLYGTLFINENRNVISFGLNEKGFLGYEEINKIINSPKQIPNLNEIKMVACGMKHIVCIDYDGKLFTFGSNEKVQLGIGKDKNELPRTHIPQQIINIPPIDSISCGTFFTVCVTFDKTAYSFGDNDYGQLGLGNTESLSPQLITDLNDIEFIVCGGNHTICKTYSNEYYSWGCNYNGQLGQGHNESCNIPIKCPNWPDNIIDIKCGYSHTLLLTSKGYVYSLGSNNYGQLGLNDVKSKQVNHPVLVKDLPLIQRIECGYSHSVCIDINDNLWIFGCNECYQLGLGDYKNRYKPTLNESLHDIIDISSGGNHTFIKTTNNEIYAYGYNRYSHFGINHQENQSTPIQVFKDKKDIWVSNTRRSKAKSARK